MVQTEMSFGTAAAKAGMDEKTARKYRKLGKLPSEIRKEHTWRTREDFFKDVWPEVESKLRLISGVESKTLFEDLQRKYPGRFSDGQLRTLQRRIKIWRATEGPPKEVFFPQEHKPGRLCQSDFTHMKKLGITIAGEPFDHLIYHFVLTYSNWETGTVCFSESFESLSEGLQNALWKLGGIPEMHRTDCLTTAVQKTSHPDEFTHRYEDLLNHYGLKGQKTNPDSPHENGDVEQRHHRFKRAVEQSLLLRGHREFKDRKTYEMFLEKLFAQLNMGREKRFIEEQEALRRLPRRRLESCKNITLRVGPSSTIRVNKNVYSVSSRLVGERVEVRLYVDRLEIWYAQKQVETLPRLKGEGRSAINYRHIIDSLIRKPGAFENYRYRDELFPTIRFRITYDYLKRQHSQKVAVKEYLSILLLAARDGETAVDDILRVLIDEGLEITEKRVKVLLNDGKDVPPVTDVHITAVDLNCYDRLLEVAPC